MSRLLSEEEFEEVTGGAFARRRVVAMSILKGARTPAEIMAVAKSIGDERYGNDSLVLQILDDYWAEE
ncbi:hypothetical protein PG2001B_1733 [Bifidobacterium pseudolongum subsp. globosum]|uniref:Uncharacterized protein n=1 Tax=Bifidobacterium pseudolongum subsp. globosum TaxID=1690 RepID=A0A4Q5AUS4_9BIFI|nr:hypothetical protein [Bifidobacterium pseudolongum]RYQ36197.1 hypothetical protein PG2001B_1729 [Bifidobacterium pseudolongum subsp. globosum]RYQ36201.1 hypothetical protein PG2001B_1733 [Bifidobacterium pseudolongum subsp. globosum]